MKYIFLTLICLLAILIIFEIVKSIQLKRSFFSSIIETYLFCTSKRKKHARSEKKFNKYLARHNNRDEYYLFPNLKLKSTIIEKVLMNYQVFEMHPTKEYERIIIYLHGGAYISQPLNYHWKFCDQLVIKTSSLVVFPLYPLTPKHHYDEAFEMIKELYLTIRKTTSKKIVLMGDSSGGGLALSLNMYLVQNNLVQPDDLYLLSPWLDLTMSHPQIKEFEKIDPMLAIKPLKTIALLWANKEPLTNYLISPYYGEVDGLKKVNIYVGTREILYPEIMDFVNSLEEKEVPYSLHVGKGMNHDYLLYPIKESKKEIEKIVAQINKI